MFAKIAIDVPLFRTFSYKVPSEFQGILQRGMRVLVPFHRTRAVGICLGVSADFDEVEEDFPEKNLKGILAVDPALFYSEKDLNWLEQAADYYYCSPGTVLAQAMPRGYFDVEHFEVAQGGRVKTISIPDYTGRKRVTLTSAQQDIVQEVTRHQNKYFSALIHGVTGSGKTEVYIEIIRQLLESGKSTLYLVPEIGLTPQTLSRLNAHFSGKLLVYHSGLSNKQRLLQWQSCLADKPQVMVGTRSALFAPFQNLGVIVVDEEHDTSYKQEDHFRYHARDLALLRASLSPIPIVLGSATPSLESYRLALSGKMNLFELKERVGGGRLPVVDVIDMGREKSQLKTPLILSQKLTDAIAYHVRVGKQVILFVGQRGHSQSAYCTSCEHIQICANCDVGLKYHSARRVLKCHYCEYEKKFDGVCAQCKGLSLVPLGFGTQSVEEELRVQFPRIKMVRIDSDSFPSPKKLEEVFTKFHRGGIDLILGTQMLTKGHDFANVAFVGVVGVDAYLGLPDFRAGERAFQTIVQVAGRAGREDHKGHVLVQSYFPQHASLVTGIRQDFAGFAAMELALREKLHYPPFSRLVQLRFVSGHLDRLENFFASWQDFLEHAEVDLKKQGIIMMGPVEMAIHKLRGKYRQHILLKVPRRLKPSVVVKYLVNSFEAAPHAGIHCLVDVDPVGLM